MHVSVVIPAYNAASTIGETLASLRAQPFGAWEAIVVDDGSSDATVALAAAIAAEDDRIRVIEQPHRGVCAARNRGIALARFDWLLFLDADDWLAPAHLERMTAVLAARPDVDAVMCGWSAQLPDGTALMQRPPPPAHDLFPIFAQGYPIAVHACVVRRSLVERVGGFDETLSTCEDWDLWQRLARAGACFARMDEILAPYRLRPGSASTNADRMLADGLRVITRAYAPDPRVPAPAPAHAAGLPPYGLSRARLGYACGVAGTVIGAGGDPRRVLDAVADDRDPDLDPNVVARDIFAATMMAQCRPFAAWAELWPAVENSLLVFLDAVEIHAGAPALARRARTVLERLVVEHATAPRPLSIGATHAVRVEATAPIEDICPPSGTERLQCLVEVEGERLGTIELPVCDGVVRAEVIADAVAAEFAWPLLGRLFERSPYPLLIHETTPSGRAVRRGWTSLAANVPEDAERCRATFHDQVGWVVFLQELWGRPTWPNARFYDATAADEAVPRRRRAPGRITIEVSECLPDVQCDGSDLAVLVTVGGAVLTTVNVPVRRGMVSAQALRTAITEAGGFELCCAVVREAIIGRPLADPSDLRARLARAACARGYDRGDDSPIGEPMMPDVLMRSAADDGVLVLGRRLRQPAGTSASRRAWLPAAAGPALMEAATIAGESVIHCPAPDKPIRSVAYAPDETSATAGGGCSLGDHQLEASPGQAGAVPASWRHFFEAIFARESDPWRYTTAYEQVKYEQTLALIPSGPIAKAVELACAEGHFTAQLAGRVERLIATDISEIGLQRAAARCAGLANVEFAQLDIAGDELPRDVDLIVCSEVLYYMGDLATLGRVAKKLAAALKPGGHLVTAHANVTVDDPDQPGFDWSDIPFGARVIGETLAATRSLRLVREVRTPLYRIQAFERVAPLARLWRRPAPAVQALPQPTPLPPEVAEQVRWGGGRERGAEASSPITTDRLPILMYHRVADSGPVALERYRVTPHAFEAQLRYLRDAGFSGVDLHQWRRAIEARRPLPGRRVLLTFDDGYLDFATEAWPLLRRYGFPAVVFLVAEEVGGISRWDRCYGEPAPLLGWDRIRALQAEGVRFGSHAASHRPLTALSFEEVVREGARSRAILSRELGAPPDAFAYPYGDTDASVQRLLGGCGYVFGLSCAPTRSGFRDPLLALPRIEIEGTDDMRAFVQKLDC